MERRARNQKTLDLNVQRRVFKIDGLKRDLFASCSLGYLKMCARELIKGSFDVNVVRTAEAQQSLLFLAAVGGHASVVQHLLDVGADVEQGDGRGYTPLDAACDTGSTATVQPHFLVAHAHACTHAYILMPAPVPPSTPAYTHV